MSLVNVFIVKDDSVYFVRVHYRELQGVLSAPEKYLKRLRAKYLDAGYVVLDLDQKVIVDGQRGCALKAGSDFTVFR